MTTEGDNTGFVVFISVVAALGGFLFGFDSGVINGTVDGLSAAFQSETAGTGFSVASMLLGCAVGAFFAGALADLAGRRTILIATSVLFIASAWGSGVATATGEFVAYRLLGGLAVGAASVIAPAYISEVAPARSRGKMASIQQMAIILGMFFAFVSNYLVAAAAGGSTKVFALGYEAWRWMFWVEIVPAALFLVAMLFIPESPRYLVASRKGAKALAVLRRLVGDGAPAKLLEIEQSLASDRRPTLRDIVAPRYGLRPVAWVGVGLAALQQLVGINVIFYYGAVLWQAAGFSENDSLLINVLSGGVSIAACIVAMVLVDRVGRKPLLCFGSLGMTATLCTMAIAFGTATRGEGGAIRLSSPAALVAGLVYVVVFNATWGPVMWIMLGEMFPNQIRGSGLAVSGLSQWLANFTVTLTFPILLNGIGLAATSASTPSLPSSPAYLSSSL